jgi:hypothetical protein
LTRQRRFVIDLVVLPALEEHLDVLGPCAAACGDDPLEQELALLRRVRVDSAMAGQDAVICCLGTGVIFKHVTLFSQGTQHLLAAMHEHCGGSPPE